MKILIIKPSSFGDIIQSNPVLTALKKAVPGCAVKWLVFAEWKNALQLFPDLDGTIVWDRKGGPAAFLNTILSIRREKFDVVIDLQGLMRSAFVALFSGAKRKIGVPGMKELSFMLIKEPYPESRAMNAVFRSLESVRYLTSGEFKPEFNIKPPVDAAQKAEELLASVKSKKLIGVVPYVRGPSKQWPVGYFKELVRKLLAAGEGRAVVIFGGKQDKWNVQGGNEIDLCGKTSITELAGALKRCSVVVGGDTGPVHLAAAMDVPTVVIFGGSDIRETAPVSAKTTLVTNNALCSPCRTRPTCADYDCLKSIKPDEVYKAAEKWIR